MRARAVALLVAATAAIGTWMTIDAQELIVQREGVSNQPRIVPPTDARIAALRVPAGFRVQVFAADVAGARMFAVGDDGTLFVTRPQPGDVLALHDDDRDGRADRRSAVVDGLPGVHGIAIRDGRMYLATVNEIQTARLTGTRVADRSVLVDSLPRGGQHPRRTLGFSPDGRLYVSVGSTCNLCVERHPFHATILHVPLDGGAPSVFARGLRNTMGFAWHPEHGDMWGFDNGADWLGSGQPPEELNRLREGGDYGWPFFYGANQLVGLRTYPPSFAPDRGRRTAVGAVAGYDAHAAPMQMIFYTGAMLPEEYRGDALIAMRGSWNRENPAGYELVRVRFDTAGQPERMESFLTGFLSDDGSETFARPVGVAVAQDGAVLLGDDTNGMIYRIATGG